ncbi:hypothetical protein KMW28_07465 [Flammeovirga yaeyamensis]|uniref:Uncharacterized protein n=1 Tax=Flammeovirga yaeyamensis TaxID=367791 RepID=A0AAX1N762_9BACT|nr:MULTISPECIES: hypothetical protein [Flammeovirga]ANQ49118.1 hypothetical protein MY04_1744 [Flammeovirga sp. MY04]MBB3698019.1 hypothetical protein [Flammeovirga yaeyamensis]NMF35629.1 hypothetical protein [Flammeovirga yaeyamensis]QWG03414.1 hypothetical protein KMW28_07465 [Flammeovirga yaeyamensis]
MLNFKSKTFLSLTLLLLSFSIVSAQKGKMFPKMEATTINDKEIVLPNAVKGKATLIGVAYSKKSQENLESWMQPIYTTFINPPKSDLFGSTTYNVNMQFVALARGIAKAAEKTLKSSMKKNIDKKLHDNVAIVLGSVKEYKNSLGLGAKDVPYFFILDPNGKILFVTSGKYSPSKMSAIEDALYDYTE